MSLVGSESNPLRVAIIGSGPAGFYTVSNLLKQRDLYVEMDMYERLPCPFGLVRAGVAPDHQKDKKVMRVFDKNARNPNYRFYGFVEYGKHIHLEDLKNHYHQIMFATGAPADRDLGIPGEDLEGSHSATDFVAWYNGHPDYVDYHFDLSQQKVAIIGLGNVAVDVARIFCKTAAELARTDMADYAIAALEKSKVKEVYILGRRGPAQAAFTNPEIKEMGELSDADVTVPEEEAQLDSLSQSELERNQDKTKLKNVETIQAFANRSPTGKSKLLTIRFLVSPAEIIGDGSHRVSAIKMAKNESVTGEDGSVRAKATGRFETLPVGLVFRSVGYRGTPLPEIPFNGSKGTIENEKGRVVNSDSREALVGLYVAGWIKRGATGIIGTNKTDAKETVACMMEDLRETKHLMPDNPDKEAARDLVKARQPQFISYADWLAIDEVEVARGQESNRPRVKFINVKDMLAVLGR